MFLQTIFAKPNQDKDVVRHSICTLTINKPADDMSEDISILLPMISMGGNIMQYILVRNIST